MVALINLKLNAKKLTEEQIEDLVNAISEDIQKRIIEVDELKYMPTTEPYINQERWKDGE